MVNITTTEMHEIAAIIDSIDCQRHMLACGIKDTEYLVQQFLHQMKAINPISCCFDFIPYDGAMNTQKEGGLLVKQFFDAHLHLQAKKYLQYPPLFHCHVSEVENATKPWSAP